MLLVKITKLLGPILEYCLSFVHGLVILQLCKLNFIVTILSSWGRFHVKAVALISYGLSYLGRLVYNLHTHLFRCNLWQESGYTILFILVLILILFRSHLLVRLRPKLIWVNSLPLWWLHRLILRVFSQVDKLHLAIVIITIFVLVDLLIILITLTMRSLLFFLTRHLRSDLTILLTSLYRRPASLSLHYNCFQKI